MKALLGILCLYGVALDTVFDWMDYRLAEEREKLEKKYSK